MNPSKDSAAGVDSSPPAGGPVLMTLEGAAFGYSRSPVIAGVDISVMRGDFLGIVGPNGAGKTTLLRGMIGLLKPIEGSVRFGELSGRRPVIGYVPQVQALDSIFPLTVGEVVTMGAYHRMRRLSLSSKKERNDLGSVLERVGMAGQRKELFASLSAGQKQRVLIARALMTRPDILLLDEPTSGVDQAGEKAVMDLLGALNRGGLAVVLVCHEMDMVRENVRDVLWVSRGRIERGSVEEMLSAAMVRDRLEGGQ